ncbi:TPA: hypothetical protein N0F65_004546 [Lagenidium giganteum]|uniref:DDE-1 domain-containing protein n=1 Tax=Lagenidium giganteum TaxID=4803 RepID=A0AAV2ZC16_9STRA|nr:TPA: hypothetical protein N0F65_004546 [Lagenidium giganteum]
MATNSFRASVFLCVSASGFKLKPFMVLTGSDCGKARQELVQEARQFDEGIMHEWIDEVWAPNVESTSVLLLDNLKVHKMSSVRSNLEELETLPQFIPPGASSVSQALDVSVMRVFKMKVEDLYMQTRIFASDNTSMSATE